MIDDDDEGSTTPEPPATQPVPTRPPPPAKRMNLRAFAAWFGVSHTAVQQAIQRGALRKSVRRRGRNIIINAPLAAIEWEENTRAHVYSGSTRSESVEGVPSPGTPASLSPLTAATIREREARTKKWEFDYLVKQGHYIARRAVLQRGADMIGAFRQKLLGLPVLAKQRLDLTPEQTAGLDTLVRETLDELVVERLTLMETRHAQRDDSASRPPAADRGDMRAGNG